MKKVNWKIMTAVLAAFMLGMLLVWSGPLNLKADVTSAAPALFSEDTVTGIYANASPAVVEINVTQNTGMRGYSAQGEGSGFVVDSNGDIMTNNHVVDGASSVKVTFENGNTVDATVVGTDSVHDLAVVKVDPSAVSGITPLQFGDSGTLKPGQMAVAIGAPYGLADTITIGIVSGLNRDVSGSSMTGMVQTDAAINPGNSGGPLLDGSGEVIGINTAIEPGATGIGFAIPSNVAKTALPNLISGKQTQRVWLGISGTALTADLAQQLSLSVNEGMYVVSVTSGSPADKAGLKGGGTGSGGVPGAGGDVITAVDGTVVKSVPDITNYFASKQVGDQVTLTVLRGGNSISVSVTLAAWPTNQQSNPIPNQMPNQMPNFPWPWGQRTPRD